MAVINDIHEGRQFTESGRRGAEGGVTMPTRLHYLPHFIRESTDEVGFGTRLRFDRAPIVIDDLLKDKVRPEGGGEIGCHVPKRWRVGEYLRKGSCWPWSVTCQVQVVGLMLWPYLVAKTAYRIDISSSSGSLGLPHRVGLEPLWSLPRIRSQGGC